MNFVVSCSLDFIDDIYPFPHLGDNFPVFFGRGHYVPLQSYGAPKSPDLIGLRFIIFVINASAGLYCSTVHSV